MLRSAVRAVGDLMIHPMISQFAFEEALRMPRHEFLRGASAAATAIVDTLDEAVRAGDVQPLRALESERLVPPLLCEALGAEVLRAKRAGDHAVAAQLELLASQRKTCAEGTPTLESVRLLVGAQRASFAERAEERWYSLSIGSHLVILDPKGDHLWKQSHQQRLLAEGGCTVQCTVNFAPVGDLGGSEREGARQQYVFEAAVEAEHLHYQRNDESDREWEARTPSEEEAHSVMVVDLNSISPSGGVAFWRNYTEELGWK